MLAFDYEQMDNEHEVTKTKILLGIVAVYVVAAKYDVPRLRNFCGRALRE